MRFLALAWLLLPLATNAGEPSAEAVLADLPFLEHPDPNRIAVDLAKEGNRPLVFLVDTGASHTVATPNAAKELGIRVRRTKQTPYRRSTVVGRDVQIFVDTRSSDTASKTGWEYALLGSDFLGEYVVEFDFAARRMRLLDRKRFEVPEASEAEGETVLRIVRPDGRPGVRTPIAGRDTVFLVDTGAALPMIMSGKTADAVGVRIDPRVTYTMRTVFGQTPAQLGWLDDLRLASLELGDTPVVVMQHGWHNQALKDGSVLGYEFLSRFKVRIDYPRERMWLERRPDHAPTFGGHAFSDADDLVAKLGAGTP